VIWLIVIILVVYEFELSPDPLSETATRWRVARDDEGEWYGKLIEVQKGSGSDAKTLGPEESVYDRVDPKESGGFKSADSPECEMALAKATHWHPLRNEWLEEAYQRCVRFFDQHPGLTPETDGITYAHDAFDSRKPWRPPERTPISKVKKSEANGRAAYERAKARAEKLSWTAPDWED